MTGLLHDAAQSLRWRLALLVIFILMAGLFEGLGVSMLFPLLAHFGVGQASGSVLQGTVQSVLSTLRVPNELGALLAVVVLLLYLQVAFATARAWAEANCLTRYAADWRRRLFSKIVDADWGYITRRNSSAQINRVMNEAVRISQAFNAFVQIATMITFIAVYAVISLFASWKVVVGLLAFAAVSSLIVRPLTRRARVIGVRQGIVNEAMTHRATELFQSTKLIKATASEDIAKRLFYRAVADCELGYREAIFQPKLVYGAYMALGYTGLGLGLWAAVGRFGIDPAAVIVTIFLFLRVYVQLTNVQQLRQQYLVLAPAFDACRDELAQAEGAAERQRDGLALPDGPASLQLRDVTVAYDGTVALERVSLDVPAGATIGITGPSGAGKSTLLHVVAGLLKPISGDIRVDDVPLQRVMLHAWRRSIGYVGQDTMLLNDTIHANISWGTEFDHAAVEAAACAASAHDFISALPEGYATQIGDHGVRLSGGQRQRLGLARALLGRKRILLLDEATSALDLESEREILLTLAKMKGKVTILLVAHRLPSLADTDRIVVVDKGRVAEQGTWSELTLDEGAFARLLDLQSGGRITVQAKL